MSRFTLVDVTARFTVSLVTSIARALIRANRILAFCVRVTVVCFDTLIDISALFSITAESSIAGAFV